MNEVLELIEEAREIIRNAHAKYRAGEITAEQRGAVIRNTTNDVGYQLEIIPQPARAES
jgi:hypothetical protein